MEAEAEAEVGVSFVMLFNDIEDFDFEHFDFEHFDFKGFDLKDFDLEDLAHSLYLFLLCWEPLDAATGAPPLLLQSRAKLTAAMMSFI